MTDSRLPLVRIILIPYLILFFLFVAVSGAGSAWLYFKAREAQSQLLVHGLLKTVTPLVEQLAGSDIGSLITDDQSWLHLELDNFFARLPDLKQVRIRSENEGFSKFQDAEQHLVTKAIPGRDVEVENDLDLRGSTAPERLYSESAPLLRIEFQLAGGDDSGPATLELGFSRVALRESVGRAMATLVNAISLFSLIGVSALGIAFAVTLWASDRIRKLEIHFQELYRFATIAELMAGLVHDLRNPLASFRANIASLRISDDDREQILVDMDRDIVRFDEKLSSILDLTRKREEPLQKVDMEALLATVVRLAGPVYERQGLEIKTSCRLDGPVELMENSMRDALLNMVLNSAESGQSEGAVEIEVRRDNRTDELVVEIRDRGCGLPENTEIFKPFVTTKPHGHGLGLAIARRTVEAHGGTLVAGSREGGGVVFTVKVPQPVIRRKG